jgi:ABC-type sugar transport system permease subunit
MLAAFSFVVMYLFAGVIALLVLSSVTNGGHTFDLGGRPVTRFVLFLAWPISVPVTAAYAVVSRVKSRRS